MLILRTQLPSRTHSPAVFDVGPAGGEDLCPLEGLPAA